MVNKLGLMNLESFEKDSSMLVNEPILDEQHKNIFLKLNSLIKSCNFNDISEVKEAIDFLDGYYLAHFKYEENYMESNQYPYLAIHRKIHAAFIKGFQRYKKDFEKLYLAKKLDSLKLKKFGDIALKNQMEWFKNHIRTEDKKYSNFLSSKNKNEFFKSEKLTKLQEIRNKKLEIIERKKNQIKMQKEINAKIAREKAELMKEKKNEAKLKKSAKIKLEKQKLQIKKMEKKEVSKKSQKQEKESQEKEEVEEPEEKEEESKNSKNTKPGKIDLSSIKAEIEEQLKKQRAPVAKLEVEEKTSKHSKIIRSGKSEYIKTGIEGLDQLFEHGIPKGNTVIVAGGAGSGKTILCLQTLANHAAKGEKCFYMSFEESEERLKEHMNNFGWQPDKLIKSGKLKIARYSPFDITRSVDAMLAKEKGELLIEVSPVILPANFKPDFIVLDSLTAIASAFTGREDSYRVYIEQLFRFFERLGSTTFLITETEQVPKIYSTTGVEEFLADGVIVLYNIKRGDVRENAIEILKMRGEKHQKKIVAMQITGEGIVIYPEQEVFGGIGE